MHIHTYASTHAHTFIHLHPLPGFNIEWVDCKGGTGEMVTLLKQGQLDVVVALTEGLVKDITTCDDSPIRLIGTYVESPLCWAISTGV